MLKLRDKLERNDAIICIIGLGYVGLPLARTFAEKFKVIGYDADDAKVERLKNENESYLF